MLYEYINIGSINLFVTFDFKPDAIGNIGNDFW